MKKALIEMKYEPAAILGGWREKGWIDTDGDRKRYTKKVRVNGEQARLVVIPRTALEEADA